MSENVYTGKIKGGIGRVRLESNVSDAFPMVGDTVSLEAVTRWAQRVYFTKRSVRDTSVSTEEAIDNTSQKTSVGVPVAESGALRQEIRAVNFRDGAELFSASLVRYLYAMVPQVLPYHEVSVSSEIVRTDEDFIITLSGDNGYDLSRDATIQVYILKENGDIANAPDVVAVRTQADFTLSGGRLVSGAVNIPSRGIYDIETIYCDTATGVTIGKRANKLVTVTPRLAARPAEGQEPLMGIVSEGYPDARIDVYETGVNDCYMVFDIPDSTYYRDLNLDSVPMGYDAYTLVLRNSAGGASRVRLACTEINGNPWKSPSPQFSGKTPLVITIDSDSPLVLYGTSWNTMAFAALWHVVVDGRGYHGLSNGLVLSHDPGSGLEKPVMGLQVTNGSKYVEVFETEITGCSFAGISIKTDPTGANPWYWYGNFELDNLWLHHLYVHDTDSEGCYLGYFSPDKSTVTYTGETVTFKNLKGEDVTYVNGQSYTKKPHYLTNFRFYRNSFIHTGYDGVQISNTVGEVCYNTLRDCAYKEEASQASGLSIQSFAGKCYNNFLLDNHGPNIQIGPIGDIEVFNNIVQSAYGNGIQFLFSYGCPEQNPTDAPSGSGVVNEDLQVHIHNNVISTPGITANGRNTVQVRGIRLHDNILANNGQLLGNMTKETLAVWEAQAMNNEVFLYSELYSKAIELKIADYMSGDYRIASDSPLVDAGLGELFLFDCRGYRNWYGTVCPVGPYMGIYKSDAIVDIPIALSAISINGGASSTRERTVTVSLSYTGEATRYRIGETADLSDAAWQGIPEGGTVGYILSEGFGQKTLYCQVGSGSKNSDVKSGMIEYQATPLSLDTLVLNDGRAVSLRLTIPVSFTYSGSYPPVQYRIGEVEDLSDAVWKDMSENITYTFSGLGRKTLYGQLKDTGGNLTAIRSGSVSIEKGVPKTVVSLGWQKIELGSSSLYDDVNRLVKTILTASGTPMYTVSGEPSCTLTKVDAEGAAYMVSGTKGASTGSDSGIYPDDILEHNVCTGGNKENWREIKFTGLAPGTYQVRLFCSTISNNADAERSAWKLSAGGTDTEFVKPEGYTSKNNLTEWLEQTVEVGEDGFSIIWGVLSSGSYVHVPLNVIEIEGV